jgi:hypothetical protein
MRKSNDEQQQATATVNDEKERLGEVVKSVAFLKQERLGWSESRGCTGWSKASVLRGLALCRASHGPQHDTSGSTAAISPRWRLFNRARHSSRQMTMCPSAV